MASRETLLTVSMITDDETGLYHIGEIDSGIHVGTLKSFLKSYGHEGKKDLINSLAHLITEVNNEFTNMEVGRAQTQINAVLAKAIT